MNRIMQNIPAFVETGEPPGGAEFATLAELLAVPFVARWKENTGFIRFSKSEECLMAELGPSTRNPEGAYWVVGFLRDPAAVDLPKWIETESQRVSREEWNREAAAFNAAWEGER